MPITTFTDEGALTKPGQTILNNNFADVPSLDATQNTFSGVIKTSGITDVISLLTAATPAINPHTSASYYFTKAGVVGATIAAPTTGTDDGVTISFTNTTTDQDTLTFTGNTLNGGGTGVLTATWPAHAGGTLTVQAYAAKWYIISNNLVVIS